MLIDRGLYISQYIMETKLVLVCLTLILGLLIQDVAADFFFNRPFPNPKNNPHLKLKCVPGRTIIRVEEGMKRYDSEEYASDEFVRRKSETQQQSSDAAERCMVCVCSVDGYNEYCSERPVTSLNECLIMESIRKKYQSGVPYEHSHNLAYRIRRDLIWHNDEIPYDPDARCYRGHSYYTNHISPNETDLNFDKGVSSLLDFRSRRSCHFCVCAVDGSGAACIRRHTWFCDYFRYLRDDNSPRDMYAKLFQQDRPAYFRQLSWRLRRTMDNSMFDLIDNVGNSLDDDFQSERKSEQRCVPFVSEYTDCNHENRCNPGCTKCTCSAKGLWECQSIREENCINVIRPEQLDETDINENIFDAAIDHLEYELDPKKRASSNPHVPEPSVKSDEPAYLLDLIGRYDVVDKLRELTRNRRSLSNQTSKNKRTKSSQEKTSKNKARKQRSYNNTVKFYSTVDELNEDTLKNSNQSGTLQARRIEFELPVVSRRSDVIDSNNNKSLHINFNQPEMNNHITDNKIDITDQDHKYEFSHESLKEKFANQTTKSKDEELSKLVVNELKKGTEVIGDVKAPATSNITFTSENDTLTAMAFIAGNLLNKLWNMEKDASGSSIETEDMKREKISDLLELFKEPLNLRQEDFLKRALEQLSNAIDKDKDVKNISLCQTIEEASKLIDYNSDNEEENKTAATRKHEPCKNSTLNTKSDEEKEKATIHAISKINNVLGLMKKFEKMQKKINDLKSAPDHKKQENTTGTKSFMDDALSKDDSNTFNVFGNILDKITKLIMPQKNIRKTSHLIKSKSTLNNDKAFRDTVKKMYNIDLTNITVSAKDKLVLDYIKHINSNPDCVLNKNGQKEDSKYLPNIEGNILLNLSEFFKMKSFTDLVHLLKSEKATEIPTTLRVSKEIIMRVETTTPNIDKNLTNDDKFASTKQKLKSHLKTIIEDLIELQNAKGISPQRNIRIADALPCIYNIMNAGKEVFNKNNNEKGKAASIVELFKDLKNTMKTVQTRRSDPIMRVRPKSAVVLERVIKNLQPNLKSNSRRVFEPRENSLDDVTKMIFNIRNISSTYKNQALLDEVPAAEKLVLVKTLERDINMYIRALEGIKIIFDNRYNLSLEQYKEMYEFILNSGKNITLSEKVLKKIEKVVPKHNSANEINTKFNKILNTQPLAKLSGAEDIDDNIRISRNQIIGHLIRNRVQIYMKLKEAKVLNVQNDIHYNIAKRILFYLDGGNYNLANELFKVLVMQKEDNLDNAANDPVLQYPVPTVQTSESKSAVPELQSLTQFQGPNNLDSQMKLMDQDYLIKQLLNIKNLLI